MSDRFNNIYRIPSARAVWHDYDGGFYHVTICTANRNRYFGKITVGKDGNVMELSPIGEYAIQQFQNVKEHYPYAEIPCFIVMPDHIHAIVYLGCKDVACNVSGNQCQSQNSDNVHFVRRDVACNVSNDKTHNKPNNNGQSLDKLAEVARNDDSKLSCGLGDVARYVSTGETQMMKNVKMAEISPKANTLATVIRGLKSAISKFAHENGIPFAWQTRFHDRIIRNQEELNATAKYIEDNLIKWPDEEDEGK